MITVKYAAHSDDVWGENEIDHVLVVKKNVPLTINTEEVHEARFFSVDEVFDVVYS